MAEIRVHSAGPARCSDVKRMPRFRHKVLWVGLAVATATVLVAIVASRWIDARVAASVDFKSVKTTSGTVVSVTPDTSHQQFRICFTIDNFDQLEPYLRSRYQSAEAKRLVKDGPQCSTTTKATLSARLGKGDKLSVDYLLENEGKIDVVGIGAFGQVLWDTH